MSKSVKRGMFITIDGGDGGGKSTQMGYAKSYLSARLVPMGINIKHTREPGGTLLGEQLRAILLDVEQPNIVNDAELLMMFASRAQHIQSVIEPTLSMGDWVLCDRFTDSTYAYQGGGRGIPHSRIAVLEDWVLGELRPDITFIMDLPAGVGRKRIGEVQQDRIEREPTDFVERVRQTYLSLAATNTDRYHVIDATGSIEDVRTKISLVLDVIIENTITGENDEN